MWPLLKFYLFIYAYTVFVCKWASKAAYNIILPSPFYPLNNKQPSEVRGGGGGKKGRIIGSRSLKKFPWLRDDLNLGLPFPSPIPYTMLVL